MPKEIIQKNKDVWRSPDDDDMPVMPTCGLKGDIPAMYPILSGLGAALQRIEMCVGVVDWRPEMESSLQFNHVLTRMLCHTP